MGAKRSAAPARPAAKRAGMPKAPRGKAAAATTPEEDEDSPGDTRPIAAVERALAVLGAFRTAPRLSLSELSKRTGLFKSTLLRILATLELNGYVMRLENGQYRVGGILYELGAGFVASFQIEDIVKPALERLAAATGESAAFYLRAGPRQRQCVFRVDSPHAVRHVIVTGQITDLNDAAASLILQQYGRDGSRPPADIDYATLCRATAGRGDPETSSVAAPVFDSRGFLGVINVSGPVHRFTPRAVAHSLAELAAVTAVISRALGGLAPRMPEAEAMPPPAKPARRRARA